MQNNIYKRDGNLIIEIPLKEKRWNPYDAMANDNYDGGEEMDSIVGVITNDEIGFAHWLDRDYKGKEDDISTLFYQFYGDEKDFIALCKKLEIQCIKYPECAYCGKSLFGSFTVGEKGNQCWECENEKIGKKENIK